MKEIHNHFKETIAELMENGLEAKPDDKIGKCTTILYH